MPLDPPTRVTVTDHFEDGAGNPLGGRVIFRPSVTVKHNAAMVPAGAPVVAHLSSAGNLSVELLANDGPGVTPVGWTYEVTIQVGPPGSIGDLGIDAFVREDFSIKLPSLPGAVVLREVTKVDPVPSSAFEIKTVAGVGPDVDGNVPLTASDIDATGHGYAPQDELDAVDARVVTLENHPPNHATRHAPGGVDPLTGYVATALVGVSNGVASLDSGGLIPASQLPSIAISDYLGAVGSQAAMLGLVGQRGDWCNRTDLGAAFILAAEPASTLANWAQVLTPTDAVTSVAGRTGAVTLTKSDVGLGSVDNTSDAAKPLSTAATTALAGKAASVHTHAIADVTSLQTTLNGLDAVGYVGEHFPTAAVTGSGTTEKVGCFVTFSAVSGRRYKATWGASLFSSNANTNANLITNPFAIKLRYKATSSSTDVTGTVFDGTERGGLSSAYYTPVSLCSEFVAPSTATYTVVATFNATDSSAGNLTQAYVAGTHLPKLFIECIKGP